MFFYLGYLLAELRRRPGRTALTALGLAVGVGLVVIVGALSAGLDDAQDEVLEPLTGVGTDLSVSRPLAVPDDGGAGAVGPAGPFGQLSEREQRQLQGENENGLDFDLAKLGEPGERFSEDRVVATDLSFPASEVAKIRRLDDAEDAAGSLTLNAVNIEGTVPEASLPGGAALHGGEFDVTSLTVSGVDVRKPGLATVTPNQVTSGRYLSDAPRRARGEAVVDLGYARQNGIEVGDRVTIAGEKFEVIGLAGAPLGADADNLSSKLGTALTIVALLAAFLIATLLTLASVQKHIRELGTLKALGWRQRLVVRQVAGESLVQGALGGLLGAAIGIAGAAIIDAVGPTLEASVERSSSNRAAASTRSDRERSPPAAPRSSSEPRWIQGWWRWRSALRSSAACSRAPPEGCARRAFARPTRYGARSEQQRPPRQRGDDEQASRDHPDLRARGGDPILRRGLDPGLGVGRARPDDQAGRVRRHLRALGLR